jgi:predicted ATP-grasp superfamily ATP-dependent carboligase
MIERFSLSIESPPRVRASLVSPKRKRTVLVVDGSRGSALAAVRSLGRAGWRAIAPSGTPAAASRYAADAMDVPDAVRRPGEFVAAIDRLVEAGGIDLVAPSTDAALYLLHERSVLSAAGIPVLGGTRGSVRATADKSTLLAAAASAGFPTPAWGAPASGREARGIAIEIGFPCVVKPRHSYVRRERFTHRRHRIVGSEAELGGAVAALAEADGTPPLIQAFVPGRSLAVSAVVDRGEPVALAVRETRSFDPLKGGTSVWKRTLPVSEAGVDAALRLLQAIGFDGLAEVEYQVDADGCPRLMEINPRLHGWTSLAVAAGADLPLAAARAAVGEPAGGPMIARPGVETRWLGGEVNRIRQLLHRRPELPPGQTRSGELRKAWPPWRRGMRYDGLDLADPRPAFARLLGTGWRR